MRPTRFSIRTAVAATALAAGIGGAALIASGASAASDSGSSSSSTSATASTTVVDPAAPVTPSADSSSTSDGTVAPPTDQSGRTPRGGQPPQAGDIDWSKGGHQNNGITETILTGDEAAKVTAAAQAAVPGGTVQRVETDAEGATYEAHVQKSDGTLVTVKLDANFTVTSTIDGMG